MKIKISVILLGSILILQNCVAPAVKIAADADSDQLIYQDSEVTSLKRHAVSISHYRNFERIKSNTLFKIVVENRCEKPLFINNDNISVIFKGNDNGWKSKKINVQPFHEFRKYLSDDYFYEEARVIAHVIMLANLEQVTPGEVDKAAEKVSKLRKEQSTVLYVLTELYLKPQIIKPYQSITGIVACNTSEMPEDLEGHFRVVLSIDGEEHEFTFSRSVIENEGSKVPVKRYSHHRR